MPKILFTFIALLLYCSLSAQDGIQFIKESWRAPLAKATASNKPIFVDTYTTWCAPCKKMDKEVFLQSEIGAFFNENFINLKIDMEKGEGHAFSKKYNVSVYPTLLFLSATGDVLHRVAGYKTPEELMVLAKIALDPEQGLYAMEQRFEAGDRDPDFLMKYTIARYQAYDGSHDVPAEAYLNTQGEWSKEDNMRFIFSYVSDPDSELFKYLLENKQAFIETFGDRAVSGKLQQIVFNKVKDSKEVSSLEQIDELYKKVYPEKSEYMSSKFRLTYYRQAGDLDKYVESAMAHFDKYPKSNPADLNEAAWTFYKNVEKKSDLEKGVLLAKRSIKMDKSYYNHDTLAALYFKLGNKKKAKKTLNKAIKLAKKYGEDYTNSLSLMEMINEME